LNLNQEQIQSVTQIDPKEWDQLNTSNNPFLEHRFFNALESTGCATENSGWKASHLTWRDDNHHLQALMPLYLKNHSYGEYMFDWNWANGIQRAGIDYYPKAVAAVPFSPIPGHRLLLSSELSNELQQDDSIRCKLLKSIFKSLESKQLSNLQALYLCEEEVEDWLDAGALIRNGYQFSWYNGFNGTEKNHSLFKNFDQFLSVLNSKARKLIKRERRLIKESKVDCLRYQGDAISDEDWAFYISCYQHTYLKRSGHEGYLSPEFFQQIRTTMSKNLLLVIAKRNNMNIAASLFIIGDDILYGRYWGAMQEVGGLHFECCYYQAIEYCIEHQIKCFQPGTQGDYKRRRGFIAEKVFGAYHFTHDELTQPISHYLNDEIEGLEEQFEQWSKSSPFSTK